MLVMNMLKVRIPTIKTYKFAEIRQRAELKWRKHIPLGGNTNNVRSLDPEEADKLREYEGATWLATAPRWDGHDFIFAPYGEQGSVYNLPPRVAQFLVEKYNRGVPLVCESEDDTILKVVLPSEVPEGILVLTPDLTDPLAFSSESFRAVINGEMKTISAGLAEPPPARKPEDYAISANTILASASVAASIKAKGSPVAAVASANEPTLARP